MEVDFAGWYEALPTLYGEHRPTAILRSCNEDFVVEEQLSFAPSGSGSHHYCFIEKSGLNTAYLIERLARRLKIKAFHIGFAGRKDRHAVTRQWISIPRESAHEQLIETILDGEFPGQARILNVTRHHRKLKRGAIAENRFKLILRGLSRLLTDDELNRLKSGAPNYFAYQRFGRDFGNLHRDITSLQSGRKPSEMALSAIRSFFFNEVLAQRIRAGLWQTPLPGDCMVLNGTRAFFSYDEADTGIEQRLASGDIHLSGPLVGNAEDLCQSQALAFEKQALSSYSDWIDALGRWLKRSERRALRVVPTNLIMQTLDESTQRIEFALPSGSYATAVLRELVAEIDSKREMPQA